MCGQRTHKTQLLFLVLILFGGFFVHQTLAQRRIYVEPRAEGAYWVEVPKPWFTRLVVISPGNRKLPKNEHDDSLPTLPAYYYRRVERDPFTRYPYKSIVVRRGKASFTTKQIRGTYFVFLGRWGTENDKESQIDAVPFMKGVLLTYRKGRMVKRERVKFGHEVNA